ncbi:MAG: lytic transglycosylase domain-containing protein [Alphaproteobacteria bacterium]|nr:lytic transglycosylase domain-containing protein [Alphaproteobacteria bacterium]NCQ66821.1 lytic transglycosylase domain-containing protein [Alphaproteobacteria bacterium]NCT07389.1 lytic transglycosylase domain-containing protein [Alphaproteobacteria bacterium]
MSGFLIAFSHSFALATEKSAAFLCQKQIARAEKANNIPPGLLSAISIIESGKKTTGHEDLVAWPWVINVNGKPEYYKTKTDAVKSLNKHLEAGKLNIDVGCMQVNYRHHGAEFRSPTYMMDPRRNVDYAAKFLMELRRQHGSWTKAVGHYHSATLKHQTPYRHKVYKKWQKVRHEQRKNQQEPSILVAQMSEQSKRLLRPLNKNPATRQTGYEIIHPKEPAVYRNDEDHSPKKQEDVLTVSDLQEERQKKEKQNNRTIEIPTIQQLNAKQLNTLIYSNGNTKAGKDKRKPYFFTQ